MTHIKTCSGPEHDLKTARIRVLSKTQQKSAQKTRREDCCISIKKKMQNSVLFCSRAVSTGSCPGPHMEQFYFFTGSCSGPHWSSFIFSRGHAQDPIGAVLFFHRVMLRTPLEQFFCRRSCSGPTLPLKRERLRTWRQENTNTNNYL